MAYNYTKHIYKADKGQSLIKYKFSYIVFNQVTSISFEMRIAHHHVFHQKLIHIHKFLYATNRLHL